MIREMILAGAIVALPVAAHAQEPAAPAADAGPVLGAETSTAGVAETVPMPRVDTGLDDYRLMVIAAGTVSGVVAANALTGGLITPVLSAGMSGGGMMSGGGYVLAATQTAVTAAGALVGGYVGNWLYGY